MNTFKKLALGLAVTGLVVAQASATVAYNFSAATGNQIGGQFSLGDVFTVNSSISVDQLGVIGGSASASSDVAIYSINLSGNTITSSSQVALKTGITSGSASANGDLQSITPVVLAAGTYLIVANNMGASGVSDYNPVYDTANGPNFPDSTGVNHVTTASSPNITFSALGFFASSGSLPANVNGFTADTFWTGGGPRYGAGNFDFAPVPEIGVFGTASAGLLGLIYVGRCGLRKRKVA